MVSETTPIPGPDRDDAGRRVLEIVDRLVRELEPRRRAGERVGPASRLDRDLGLDSLARAELLLRIEREFDVDLPEEAIAAETPKALLQVLTTARGHVGATFREGAFPPLEAVAGTPSRSATLNDVLDWHLQAHADRVHIYLYGDGDEPRPLTYLDLERGAQAVAAGLKDRGVEPGDSVALMLPTGNDYCHAFYGILRARAVPVPIYPPARASQLEEHLRRHGRILTSAEARVLITVPRARTVARLLRAEAPLIEHIDTVEGIAAHGAPAAAARPRAEDLALLQYTSGSTGDPKGVMLTHGHLLANIRAMGERLEVTSRDSFVSWLPLYHDMGLIGAWLGSLYFAVPLALMSPLAFLGRPLRWLRAIDRHRATISGGPNFGYELALRAAAAHEPEDLDLSTWRAAFNGAEPVSPVTLERFRQRFAPCGLRHDALMPVYGMAEAAVGLTFPHPRSEPRIDRVDRDAFTANAVAKPSATEPALAFVGCGYPLAGYELRVVDEAGRELPDRHEGHIQFRGPSATTGYANNPEASRDLFDGTWLRTGDRGYLVEGEIYVTGRVKDVIIRGGRNIYPYELEEAVGAVDGVRKGCVAAFGCRDGQPGIEELVVVAETRETDASALARMEQAVHERVIDVVDIPPDVVRFVPPHSVLKTSSGKLRRSATRQLYQTGRLGARPAAVWWQVARLGIATARARSGRRARRLLEQLYAAYAWCVFAVLAVPVWLLVVLLPRRAWRWRVAHSAARCGALLTGIRIERQGLEHLPSDRRYLLAANHASYVDALVLTAALPHDYRYLAKQELANRFFARVALRRLGSLFVERFDPQQATTDSDRVFAAARAGDPLAFFVEGTFDRAPGLRPFHMGAFLTAARSGLPMVPVALRGTRAVMRGSEWFPRPGSIRISIGPPLAPAGTDWEAALALRDRVRAFILAGCGEPDLARD